MISTSQYSVLLVEDDTDIRETISEVLVDEGYQVKAAANGREALELLRTTSTLPTVILLDLMMPGMDGWQFRSEQVKTAEWAAIPLVVISADSQTRAAASGLGAVGFLRKPLQLQDLLDTLQLFRTRLHLR